MYLLKPWNTTFLMQWKNPQFYILRFVVREFIMKFVLLSNWFRFTIFLKVSCSSQLLVIVSILCLIVFYDFMTPTSPFLIYVTILKYKQNESMYSKFFINVASKLGVIKHKFAFLIFNHENQLLISWNMKKYQKFKIK